MMQYVGKTATGGKLYCLKTLTHSDLERMDGQSLKHTAQDYGVLSRVYAEAERNGLRLKCPHPPRKSYDSATEDELNAVAMQLEKIKVGRVDTVLGHKVKKDKFGFFLVDGGNPISMTGAMKQILNNPRWG